MVVRAQTAPMLPAYTITYSGVDRDETPPKKYTYTVAMRSNGDISTGGQGQRQVAFRSIGTYVLMGTENLQYKTTTGNGKPQYAMITGNSQPVAEVIWPADCAGIADLTGESKEMLGTKVLHLVKSDSQKDSDGGILTHSEDVWIAPSFNCKALYSHDKWTYNGVSRGDKEETATAATLGEPDPALFEIHGLETTPDVFYTSIGLPLAGSPARIRKYQADEAARAAESKSDENKTK